MFCAGNMGTTKVEDVKFTPFTEGKIRVWFKMIDVGKDGCMCREDFQSIAERFVKVSDRYFFSTTAV